MLGIQGKLVGKVLELDLRLAAGASQGLCSAVQGVASGQ